MILSFKDKRNNILCFGGGLILLKSVLACLPVRHFLDFRLLLVGMTNPLKRKMRTWLSKATNTSRVVHLLKWEEICKPFEKGVWVSRGLSW